MLLGGQSILVCFAWIAAQITPRSTTVHGMMLGQSVWLFYIVFVESFMAFGNFYLFGYGIVVLLTAATHFGFVLWFVHSYLHFKRKHR